MLVTGPCIRLGVAFTGAVDCDMQAAWNVRLHVRCHSRPAHASERRRFRNHFLGQKLTTNSYLYLTTRLLEFHQTLRSALPFLRVADHSAGCPRF